MKKTMISAILSVFLIVLSHPLASSAASVEPAKSQAEVNVNGEFIQMDVHPVLDNNHLFLPIRAFSSLGFSYSWNPSSKIATIQNKNGDYLKIAEGSNTAYRNEVAMQMDQPAQNKDGRVLVPVRFVTETLGFQVQFEKIRNIVFITSKDYIFNTDLLSQDDLQAARKAAISLPLNANFKTLEFPTRALHNYTFPEGRADTYLFEDSYTNTLVQIKNGKAVVIAQFVMGARSDFAYKAGNVTGTDYSDPITEPFRFNLVNFYRNLDSTTTTYYHDKDGNSKEFKSPIKVYSDLIQKVPGNK